jgi:DNA-directed RNA polymerase subunit beta'
MLKDFKALKITLASPSQILEWSHGEVKKAETINYRTQRAEVGGLMCERIFGPTKNYECYCGKYKKIRYKGIVCDKCGVEVTTRNVRRERLGHIKLASPITHVWFVHEVPNKLALLLDIPQKKIVSVIYFSRYIVLSVDENKKNDAINYVKNKIDNDKAEYAKSVDDKVAEINKSQEEEIAKLKKELKKKGMDDESIDLQVEKEAFKYRQNIARLREEEASVFEDILNKNEELLELVKNISIGEVISEEQYGDLLDNDLEFYELGMGSEAIRTLLSKLNLEELSNTLYKDINAKSAQKRVRAIQRLKIIEGLRKNNMKPEWMVLDVIPVIPPDLRPIIQLSGGKFATSDLNDLYRRVINRNNRLKKLIDLGAPEVILRNEKRMLQESVDALFDNQHRASPPVVNSRRIPYKSLSDNIRGKHGRFRENLLGKRVDYSGRAVITSGPELLLNQCGLPKKMALELFKPFVIREILYRGLSPNIKSAKIFFESEEPEVWDILEDVIKDRPVLLNRAPTLHKQGIQGFYPILIEGDAIKLHPLVCPGFNADFDGDAMTVHLPLSEEAIQEVKDLTMADSNLFLASDGSPIVTLKQDMVYGCYYLTSVEKENKDLIFGSKEDLLSAHNKGVVSLRELVKVRIDGEFIETTPGRVIFNNFLHNSTKSFINEPINDSLITDIVVNSVDIIGKKEALVMLDDLKKLGFKYALKSDFSIAIEDCDTFPEKESIISDADEKISKIASSFKEGLITKREKIQLSTDIWKGVTDKIADLSLKNLKEDNLLRTIVENKFMGANIDQLKQIIGMKGLVVDPNSNIVELPIKSSYINGLTVFEYLVEARSSRKGLADVALRTSDSGYLTRRMVDVSHDVIIREDDCNNFGRGYEISKSDDRKLKFSMRVYGRALSDDILDSDGNILYPKNTIIDRKIASELEKNPKVKSAFVRTPLTCGAQYGICAMCYGYDMSENSLVKIGKAVGVIAAQSLGQKGSQLTLNSKHLSGIMGSVDMSRGYPRIEELLEARIPKGVAKISDIDGIVKIESAPSYVKVKIVSDKNIKQDYILVKGDVLAFKSDKKVLPGTLLYTNKNGVQIVSPFKGIAKVSEGMISVESSKVLEVEYTFSPDEALLVTEGEKVKAGTLLTKGNIDPNVLLHAVGIHEAQKYIIDNLLDTYEGQGISIYDKHVEILVAQMGRYVRVTDPGDSDILPGSYKDIFFINEENKRIKDLNGRPIVFERKLSGITGAALHTESFLSAVSFQEQIRVLSDAAISGKIDYLRGLKENVIIGRKIPTGEGARLVNSIK